jgi:hypothetical protein
MRDLPNLRINFVQMLFALSIGQLAIKVGDLIIYSNESFFTSLIHYPYAYLHLALCVIILTCSWVGWQLSQSTDNSEKINLVFSWQYLILLIDISLVICYFILVRGSEVDSNITHAIQPANAYIETFWSCVIFSLYFVWDFFTKVPTLHYEKGDTYFIKKTIYKFSSLERTSSTLFCMFVSLIIFITMKNETDPWIVSIVDCILISLFFIFRGLKQEIKKIFKYQAVQIPESLRNEIQTKYPETSYPITIEERKQNLKLFVVKVFPFLVFTFFIILYLIMKYYIMK